MSIFTASLVEERRKRRIPHYKRLILYMRNRHLPNFPEDQVDCFAKELSKLSIEGEQPGKKVVDGIAKEWKIWAPYVHEDDKMEFFKYELRRCAKIHVVATSSCPGLDIYLGNKVRVVKPLPVRMSTSVTTGGKLLVNGKELSI